MLKYIALLAIGLSVSLPASAEIINNYQNKGCRYEGTVKDGKPEGQGNWQCQDGRSYKGGFKAGKFDGKGVYVANVGNNTIFLEPFNVNSTKIKGMTLSGRFQKGVAHGSFNVSQNDKLLFIMKFDKGMIQEVKLPKAAKK
ncbi:hypothetical protein [Neisseria iguanae]|uniref:MORN repeat protein n=1 Tax=Neisseria iguanae TaxID=90242 RepID=A0A2P7TZA7_9NEIS|nr:hypothetical protein [Neisseria iguanae]PSJ79973.1 hypothetical protein C7N83_09105 [Neisseria iguanae]